MDINKLITESLNAKKYMDTWYLVKIGDEYFAEKMTMLKHHEKPKKILFRDFNGNVMSLGKEEKWASDWIKTKNEIDGNDIRFRTEIN